MKTIIVSSALLSLLLAGCGGGDGASAPVAATPAPVATPVATPTPPALATINGTATKGPLNGATVCIFKIDNAASGKKGAAVVATTSTGAALTNGCTQSAADGSFSLSLPAATLDDLLIEVTGGTYCSNEALFDKTSLACAGSGGQALAMGTNVMRSAVVRPAAGATAAVVVTPFSTAAIANAVASGTLSSSVFQTQFSTLMASLGLPAITAATPAINADLAAALAAVAKVIGTLPSNYTQTVADLALAKLTYHGGAFTLPTLPTTAAAPALDVSKCATPINAGNVTGGGSCGAGAVGDFTITTNNTFSGAKCNLRIAAGVFTLSNGTTTITANMNGGLTDSLTYSSGIISSLQAEDRLANQDLVTIQLTFAKGAVAGVNGIVSPVSGTQTSLICFNL